MVWFPGGATFWLASLSSPWLPPAPPVLALISWPASGKLPFDALSLVIPSCLSRKEKVILTPVWGRRRSDAWRFDQNLLGGLPSCHGKRQKTAARMDSGKFCQTAIFYVKHSIYKYFFGVLLFCLFSSSKFWWSSFWQVECCVWWNYKSSLKQKFNEHGSIIQSNLAHA